MEVANEQKFTIRTLSEDDYPMLCEWWKGNRFPAPAQNMLPGNGSSGLILYSGDMPVVAGFLYFTNSAIMWMEFLVANPKYRNSDRKQAIQMCINELCGVAQRKGYEAVFTSVKNSHAMNHYQDCGFQVTSVGTSEMVLKL